MYKPSEISDVLGSLLIGESVLFETRDDIERARNSIYHVQKTTGLKFVRMSFLAGLRIWCVGEDRAPRRRDRSGSRFTVDADFPVPPESVRFRRRASLVKTPVDPEKVVRRDNAPVYGLIRKLTVGQSRFFAKDLAANARAYASRIAKDENRKFETRKVSDKLVRVTRLL